MQATTIRPGDYIAENKLRSCNRCGAHNLAWWKSTRTGRWILVNTAPSKDDLKNARGVRYIAPWSAHRCERELKRRAEREARMREIELRELLRPMHDILLDAVGNGDDVRAATFVSYIKRVTAEFEAGTFDGHHATTRSV